MGTNNQVETPIETVPVAGRRDPLTQASEILRKGSKPGGEPAGKPEKAPEVVSDDTADDLDGFGLGELVDDEKDKPKPKPASGKWTDWDELAEALGVEVKDLYDLPIKFGKDTGKDPMTLGGLKDAYGKIKDINLEHGESLRRKTELEAQQIALRGELSELMTMVNASPALIEKASMQYRERLAAENKLTLMAIPGWRDPAIKEEQQGRIGAFTSKWRITESEVRGVADHRVQKMLLDCMNLWDRFDSARAESKRVLDTGRRGFAPRRGGAPVKQQAKPRGSHDDAVSRVSQLLKGK